MADHPESQAVVAAKSKPVSARARHHQRMKRRQQKQEKAAAQAVGEAPQPATTAQAAPTTAAAETVSQDSSQTATSVTVPNGPATTQTVDQPIKQTKQPENPWNKPAQQKPAQQKPLPTHRQAPQPNASRVPNGVPRRVDRPVDPRPVGPRPVDPRPAQPSTVRPVSNRPQEPSGPVLSREEMFGTKQVARPMPEERARPSQTTRRKIGIQDRLQGKNKRVVESMPDDYQPPDHTARRVAVPSASSTATEDPPRPVRPSGPRSAVPRQTRSRQPESRRPESRQPESRQPESRHRQQGLPNGSSDVVRDEKPRRKQPGKQKPTRETMRSARPTKPASAPSTSRSTSSSSSQSATRRPKKDIKKTGLTAVKAPSGRIVRTKQSAVWLSGDPPPEESRSNLNAEAPVFTSQAVYTPLGEPLSDEFYRFQHAGIAPIPLPVQPQVPAGQAQTEPDFSQAANTFPFQQQPQPQFHDIFGTQDGYTYGTSGYPYTYYADGTTGYYPSTAVDYSNYGSQTASAYTAAYNQLNGVATSGTTSGTGAAVTENFTQMMMPTHGPPGALNGVAHAPVVADGSQVPNDPSEDAGVSSNVNDVLDESDPSVNYMYDDSAQAYYSTNGSRDGVHVGGFESVRGASEVLGH